MAFLQRALTALAVVAALFALLIAKLPDLMFPTHGGAGAPLMRGRNGTVLFLALAESGQINIMLSAAQALIEKHPDIKIHMAAHPSAKDRVQRVGSGDALTFHALPGLTRADAITRTIPECTDSGWHSCIVHPPGRPGVESLRTALEICMWPWTGEEHLALHDDMVEVMGQVDPAVVLVDWANRPSVDAVRTAGRQYMLMTPLAVADILAPRQPYAAFLWKYPAWGTGFSFPVPWKDRWENAYMAVRVLSGVLARPNTKHTINFLSEHGIDSADISGIRDDVYFITQTPPEVSLPLDVGHPNLLNVGPMLINTRSAHEQDADLAAWVERAPTAIVNLGSLFEFNEAQARLMAQALTKVLEQTNVQVLWKFGQKDALPADVLTPLAKYVSAGRIKISKWISIDTLPLLSLKNVAVSVNHGGASSCYEALTAGVPQVVVPQWHDHYGFAQLVEDRGLGIRAIRDSAPNFTVHGIVDPMLRILQDTEESNRIRREAERIGEIMKKNPGGDVAAAAIARVAHGFRPDLQYQ